MCVRLVIVEQDADNEEYIYDEDPANRRKNKGSKKKGGDDDDDDDEDEEDEEYDDEDDEDGEEDDISKVEPHGYYTETMAFDNGESCVCLRRLPYFSPRDW